MTNKMHLSYKAEISIMGTMQNEFAFKNANQVAEKQVLAVTVTSRSTGGDLADTALDFAIQHNTIPVAQPKPVYNFTGKTVLAVDDVLFNLTLIEMFFKNTGAHILFAANGREALDICNSDPRVNIVLMDIQMPVMNGFEATREIHKLNPRMPVIAITAFVHSDDKQRCFDAGCNDFLSKPCSRTDMLSAVRNFL